MNTAPDPTASTTIAATDRPKLPQPRGSNFCRMASPSTILIPSSANSCVSPCVPTTVRIGSGLDRREGGFDLLVMFEDARQPGAPLCSFVRLRPRLGAIFR